MKLLQYFIYHVLFSLVYIQVAYSYKLEYKGGITSDQKGFGVALISIEKENHVVRVGDILPEFGELIYVDRRCITFLSNSETKEICNYFGGSSITRTPIESNTISNMTKTTVDRNYIDHLLKNELHTIIYNAGVEPVVVNSTVVGFRIFQIDIDSIYEKIGFHNEDVITKINGIGLNDAAKAITILNSLRHEELINIELARNGLPFRIVVNIK